VCANASFDKRIGAATAEGLAALYKSLSAEYVDALSSGRPIQAVEEDLLGVSQADTGGGVLRGCSRRKFARGRAVGGAV